MFASPQAGSGHRQLVDLLLHLVGAGSALLGGVAVLTGSSLWPVGPAVALVLLVVLLLLRRRDQAPTWDPLGTEQLLRGTVIAVSLVALVARSSAPSGPGLSQVLGAGAAAFVAVACLVAEPVLARSARFQVPLAVGLPGLPPARRFRDLGVPAVASSVAASAVGLLLAAVGASSWWWLVVAVLAAVPVGLLALDARTKVVLARRQRVEVPRAVAAYAPDFVVYTSRPDDASYQVLMWLPYLQQSGLRLVVVTRGATPAAALAAQTSVPVVEARRMADLENLVVPSLRAVFYVNASSGNGAMVRFQHLTHVYLGHGDSDKPPSYNPTHAMYDEIFVAGPAATRRYAAHGVHIPPAKFRIVGRPQVANVLRTTSAVGSVAHPVVLYAPTWRGHVEETMLYSLPEGDRIVRALLDRGATVIFRPHPFSYDFPEDVAVIRRIHAALAEDTRRTGRAHLWGAAAEADLGILDCINASDAMVSDVSSVVVDYLFSGKPFAMIAVPAEPEAFLVEFPVAAASYVVRGDLANLDDELAVMLDADPMVGQRLRLRADYLGDFPAESYVDAFVSAVQHVARQQRPDQANEDLETENPESEDPAIGDPETADSEIESREIEQRQGSAAEERLSAAEQADGPARDDLVARIPGLRGLRRYHKILQRVGLELVGTVVAVLALAVALAGGPRWLPGLLALLAVAAVLGSSPQALRRSPREGGLLAVGEVVRVTLLVTLAVMTARLGWLSAATGTALVLLGLALTGERWVRSAWEGFGLTAVNLPAALQPVRELVPRGWLALAGFGVLLLGFVLVWFGGATETERWPAGWYLVGAVLVLLLLVVAGERAMRQIRQVETGETRFVGALTAHAPKFAVYFASTVGASYQIGMWLPYFVRLGRPFVVVTRTVPMLRQVARLCEEQGVAVPVVHRPTLRSLEDVIVPSMTTAFYVNNAVRNTHFIERRELTHVWLNHGDSEKPACYNPVHAIYDLIFAAGRAGVERYARHGVDIPAEKFRVVGRPQVEQIAPARGPVADQQPPTVLYAPTWQGPYADTRVYSLPLGAKIVQALLDRGVRVVFRAHPFNYRYPECEEMIVRIQALLDGDRRRSGRQHLWGEAAEQELSIEDCFNLSDAMISDVSAVVSDYLHSAKPFAMVSVGRSPEQLVAEAPAARAAYVLREDLTNLSAVLDDLLGADPLAPTRDATRIYYLGDFDHEHYADGFLDEARRVIDS